MREVYVNNGVIHQINFIKTPQPNEIMERKHGCLLNVSCSLHFQASLAIQFLGECVLRVAYLKN